MTVENQIKEHIATLPEPKRSEIQELHNIILQMKPENTLWYLDGKNEQGKLVTNPNIGYGFQTMQYADGKTRDFYQVGISAKATGISVYIIGIEDKKFLAETYGKTIGKAKVTGYCINFKALKDINIEVLKEAIQHRFKL